MGDDTSITTTTASDTNGAASGTGRGQGSTGGGGSADSYIGSLISLTSKSEIRYEGILYTVDTENSNIALQDVRSFGTEGRKKDGPLIPPSEKVFDYIIFRGTDIKDLQVKSSPPPSLAPSAAPHPDPAIISLQCPYTPPAQSPSAAKNLSKGPAQGSYPSLAPAGYQNNFPSMYQPATAMGPWGGQLVPPGASGNLGMPMYWSGYYRPPSGIPHLHQQSPMPFQALPILPPPTYLGQAQAVAQQLPSVVTSTQEVSVLGAANVAHLLQPNLPWTNTKDSLVTTTVGQAAPLLQLDVSSTSMKDSSASMLDMAPSSMSLPTFTTVPSLEKASLLDATSVFPDEERDSTMTSKTPLVLVLQPADPLPNQVVKNQPVLAGSSLHPGTMQPLLKHSSYQIQPSQLDETLPEPYSTNGPLNSTRPPSHLSSVTTQPLLPLPASPAHQKQGSQGNGTFHNTTYIRRGRVRGRGIGSMQSQRRFTEDFDFNAMNEKFNKGEVWGELGKADQRDKDENEESLIEDHYEDEELPKMPIYAKDDFFDSISCDSLSRGSHGERTKFSEQRRIDTETFGTYSIRSWRGRGGRGGYRGSFRGNFHGGRGRGSGGQERNLSRNTA